MNGFFRLPLKKKKQASNLKVSGNGGHNSIKIYDMYLYRDTQAKSQSAVQHTTLDLYIDQLYEV